MTKARIFTSFDFEHDEDLRNLLVGQSRNPDSPFEMVDFSVKAAMTGDWKSQVRVRIKSVNQAIILCGEYTDRATGVADELNIIREEGKPYFLLRGRANKECKKPHSACYSDKIYDWNWQNLKLLIDGKR